MKKYFYGKKIGRKEVMGNELIGDGKDGEVYQLSEEKCVKIFFNEETQQRELEALMAGQSSPVIPTVYEHGENYIVMEYVQGVSLARYLKREKELSEQLAIKILAMLDELEKIQFKRLDTEVRHILINEEGKLKVIDHKRAFTSDSRVPKKLLKGLEKLGQSQVFLNHVKNLRLDSYRMWIKE
ncbi:kinase [Bacillus sp. CH126_4D]|uniref:AarF/UbiB family protein n=1 Tax=Bacillus TaxID=1386 RepID=UPI00124C25D7|nr:MULTISPECIES: AarF/UbiB family protein [unclassified Bacillus (in: firmicutes)]KAB2460522.1 kinase [Bacillus sp. CH140a_4T]KAB2468593.1 kinase [Bacillus sp. CH126_4D]